jgi:hypothetical protein
VAADLSALHEPAAVAEIAPQPDWSVELSADAATLSYRGSGDATGHPLVALRALCAAAWPAAAGELRVKPIDGSARAAVDALGLR